MMVSLLSLSKYSPWLRIYCPRPHAAVRIICLPHAGGSASFFRRWIDDLPDTVELVAIQYPGREERLADALIDTMSAMIDELIEAISSVINLPYLLFGHSMGASVAHELCLALIQRGLRLPQHLVVSAREAPIHHQASHWHSATDTDLCEEIFRLGGTSSTLLQSDELRALMLPIIRSDYRLIETYQPTPCETPLPLSIRSFVGRDDSELTTEQAADWALFTAREFELRVFDGGHFYLQEQKMVVITDLIRLLQIPPTGVWPSTP